MASARVALPPAVRSKYDFDSEIARGKFGVVYRCNDKKTGTEVAVKVMQKKGNKKGDVEREVEILKKLDHPTLLKIHDYFEVATDFVLTTELLHGGELFDYVVEKDFLDENEAVHYMRQILDGLNYLHKRCIVHLDLKPENIVLKDKDAKQLKIIDFGTAQDLREHPDHKAMVGTPEFIAPEVLNFEPVTVAADMWAIGVITYVLLTGMSPFLGDDDMETIQNISCGEYEYPDPEEDEEGYEDISQLAKDFIDSLLVSIPTRRKTAAQSLSHPWLSTTTHKSARLSTNRLKAFRARRKWMATIRAIKVTNMLSKLVSKRVSQCEDECPVTVSGSFPDKRFENGAH